MCIRDSLKVLYLNGMTAKAKVDLDIRGDRYKEFTAVLKELIGYEGTLKLDEKEEQLAQDVYKRQGKDCAQRCRCFLSAAEQPDGAPVSSGCLPDTEGMSTTGKQES